MIGFTEYVFEELQRQKQIEVSCEKALIDAPEGYLRVKRRKHGSSFYVRGIEGSRTKEKAITSQAAEIEKLFQKKIHTETLLRTRNNIAALEALQCVYKPNDYISISKTLPDSYQEAAKFLSSEKTVEPIMRKPVQHCFDPKRHIHETVCGLFVRSKSETIIVNLLAHYEIPIDYEKQFPYPDERGVYFRPDFTFLLPDGRTIIWEHLGMLRDLEYSEHIGRKLRTYQKYHYLIGRNLLLTQDDEIGNCSSRYIDETIRKNLLPYFR